MTTKTPSPQIKPSIWAKIINNLRALEQADNYDPIVALFERVNLLDARLSKVEDGS